MGLEQPCSEGLQNTSGHSLFEKCQPTVADFGSPPLVFCLSERTESLVMNCSPSVMLRC